MAQASVNHLIRVLAVDDHPVILKGIASFLLTEQPLFVVKTASNGQESLLSVKEWKPDVVILDLNLSDTKGTGLIKKIMEIDPQPKIIVFVEQYFNDYFVDFIDSGVVGIIFKNCSQNEMIEAILTVVNDQIYFSCCIDLPLQLTRNRMYNTEHEVAFPGLFNELTRRENEVLSFIVRGLTNKEIAGTLGIKNRTVEFHVSNILSKLRVASRMEAIIAYLSFPCSLGKTNN